MSREEWQSLCDHCGICCLHKRQDEDSGEIALIGVACEFLDMTDCSCLVFEDRQFVNPDCVVLTPEKVGGIKWLPTTCAYRCVAEGRDLAWWHPLVSGDPRTVHRAGISICDRVVSGKYVHTDDIG